MKKHILGMLAVLAIIASLAGVAASTAEATAFSCTWNTANDSASDTSNTLLAQAQPTCGHGTGDGYTVGVSFNNGVGGTGWTFLIDRFTGFGTSTISLPSESCGTPNDKYAPNSQHLLKVNLSTSPSCGTDTSNQHTYNNIPTENSDASATGSLCQYAWSVVFFAHDAGDPGTYVTHTVNIAATC